LEIFHASQWGTVCDDYIYQDNYADGDKIATVACYQLGYERVTRRYTAAGGSGTIWLRNLICTGSEARIIDCDISPTITNSGWGPGGCGHHEDVGLECEGQLVTPAPTAQPTVYTEWNGELIDIPCCDCDCEHSNLEVQSVSDANSIGTIKIENQMRVAFNIQFVEYCPVGDVCSILHVGDRNLFAPSIFVTGNNSIGASAFTEQVITDWIAEEDNSFRTGSGTNNWYHIYGEFTSEVFVLKINNVEIVRLDNRYENTNFKQPPMSKTVYNIFLGSPYRNSIGARVKNLCVSHLLENSTPNPAKSPSKRPSPTKRPSDKPTASPTGFPTFVMENSICECDYYSSRMLLAPEAGVCSSAISSILMGAVNFIEFDCRIEDNCANMAASTRCSLLQMDSAAGTTIIEVFVTKTQQGKVRFGATVYDEWAVGPNGKQWINIGINNNFDFSTTVDYWHHISLKIDGNSNTIIFKIDGLLVAQETCPATFADNYEGTICYLKYSATIRRACVNSDADQAVGIQFSLPMNNI
jgi:hypothetical protein